MGDRKQVLNHNQAVRRGTLPRPRRLDDGEVVFKIPLADMKVLQRIYPELVSVDHSIRLAAWKKLRKTPIAEQYLVTRTPNQVKRSPGGIIVK